MSFSQLYQIKLNESCTRPTAEFRWNEVEKCEELRAAHLISKGEEVTACYLDITAKIVIYLLNLLLHLDHILFFHYV